MITGLVFNIQRYSIHDGPGIRTTVFLKGCPLRCSWCHNPEGIARDSELILIENRCVQCGECQLVCPQQRDCPDTHVNENGTVPLSASLTDNQTRCIRCGQCVKVCPTGARQLVGRQTSVDDLMAEILKDRLFYDESGGGVTFSGGEPLLQSIFMQNILTGCRAAGIHTAVDTSGYISREDLLSAAPLTDLFLYDLKLMDENLHRKWTGVSNAVILENLITLGRVHQNIWIRTPLVPGINDDPKQIEALARFVSSVPGVRQVNILPYHDTAAHKWHSLGKSDQSYASIKSADEGTVPTSESAKMDLFLLPDADISEPIPFFSQEPTPQMLYSAVDILQTFGLNAQIGG